MKRCLFVLLISCSLCSCMKEITIDQADYTKKVVVDGWIEANDFAHIFLTFSSPFLTEYDSASIRETFINYAKVTLKTGSGDSEILTLFRREEFFPPFVYRSIRIKGTPGESYHLKIEISGRIIESETTIPQFPDVLSVKKLPLNDSTATIEAVIKDPDIDNNYYYTQIKTLYHDSIFHASEFPLYSDKYFNGDTTTLAIKRRKQPDPLNIYMIRDRDEIPQYQYGINDTVFVKISAIDIESYRTLNSLFYDKKNSNNPFSFINEETVTNINGGIGRWTGLATKKYLLF